MAAKKAPPTGPKPPAGAKFVLGSRPASLRDTGLSRLGPPKPPVNTRNYGVKTSPATALQPGNPVMPQAKPMGNPMGDAA